MCCWCLYFVPIISPGAPVYGAVQHQYNYHTTGGLLPVSGACIRWPISVLVFLFMVLYNTSIITTIVTHYWWLDACFWCLYFVPIISRGVPVYGPVQHQYNYHHCDTLLVV